MWTQKKAQSPSWGLVEGLEGTWLYVDCRQWWEQPGSLSPGSRLREGSALSLRGQPPLVPRLPCPSSGEPHTRPRRLPKRTEEGSSLGNPSRLWPDHPSSLTDQQFPPLRRDKSPVLTHSSSSRQSGSTTGFPGQSSQCCDFKKPGTGP